MGSLKKPRISKAQIDKKAESSFLTEMKYRYESLELEKEDLAKHVKSLLAINAKLEMENKHYQEVNANLKKENKKLKDEREEIFIMCQKLDKEVQRLVDEINEPSELEDK
jgi:regulator of replication initiation timing